MRSPIVIGASYARQAGVAHKVLNTGDARMAFVEIELLDRPIAYPSPSTKVAVL